MLEARVLQCGRRPVDRGGPCLGTVADLLGMDEAHVAQAHEPQEVPQVGLLEVDRLRRPLAVEPAPALDDDHPLAAEQALRPLLGIGERLAGAQHVVEPGPQRGGDAEVVHRRADHDGVGGTQLADQLVREPPGRQLGLRRGNAADAGQRLLREVRHRRLPEVAVDHARGRVGGQRGDGFANQGLGDRGFAADGAVDDENGVHGRVPWCGNLSAYGICRCQERDTSRTICGRLLHNRERPCPTSTTSAPSPRWSTAAA